MLKRSAIAKQLSVFMLAVIYSTVLLLTGCTKTDEKNADTQPQQDTTSQVKTVPQVDTTVVAPKDTLPDITGKWTGKFDSRATTLQITAQDSLNFSGRISINYREVIDQQVKGSFDPKAKTFSMKDQLHSRYQGKYSGKFSDDVTKMNGTFTMDLDGKKFTFSLSKK